ncbi:MAG: hypothetical protein GY719_37030 [bacterium]|nr:hypothetical protein [bacterium]
MNLIDEESKKVSLIDVIEKVTIRQADLDQEASRAGRTTEELVAEGFAFPLQMQLVTFWTRSKPDIPETTEVRLRLLSPTGKILSDANVSLSLEDHRNSRPVLRLPGGLYAGSGIYHFVISKRDKGMKRFVKQAEVPLEIVIEDIPSPWLTGPPKEEEKEGSE